MRFDTIVIGAGAAGLSAAVELANHGAKTLVLEASDRVGGRVRWVSLPGTGETAELGAEFIHGSAAETLEILRAIGDRALRRHGSEWLFDGTRLVPNDDAFSPAMSLLDDAHSLPADESLAVYLERFRGDAARAQAVDDVLTFAQGFDAADPARAGVRGLLNEWTSGVDSTSGRPSRGYAPLVHYLQESALRGGAAFELRKAVSQIAWRRDAVTVKTADGSVYDARTAIVTLPAAVLRRPEHADLFRPHLAEDWERALSRMETGDVARVVLLFRSAFWRDVESGRYRDASFFRCPGGPFTAYWTQYPKTSRAIVAWAGGPAAEPLLAMSRDGLYETAVRAFGRLFGDPQPAAREMEAAFMHDWRSDPFARGAYSYLGVGGEDARMKLAQPAGNALFFAGEMTAPDGQGGTVNGAIASGRRAAHEVLAALRGVDGR